MKTRIILSMLLLGATLAAVPHLTGCGRNDGKTDPTTNGSGQTRECLCPDMTTSVQIRKADGTGWEACECNHYEIWCDADTGLCWQDPQKDYWTRSNGGVTSYDAIRYCDELAFGGHDDWRLPNIDELRTLVAGNRMTRTGGLCAITEGSNIYGNTLLRLIPCMGTTTHHTGPGAGGCFWKPGLGGSCDTVDPASTTHMLEYWSSTPAADDPENWIAFIFFDNAGMGFNHALSWGEARCVRDGPSPRVTCAPGIPEPCTPGETVPCVCSNGNSGVQACTADGDCLGPCECTAFTPTPEPVDICHTCDQVNLTIRLSRKPDKQPFMLAAFLYQYGDLPFRPPDVGTEDNEIRYPDIDIDRPLTMTIQGCSYYRERCMSGDYLLLVYLKMEEGPFPSMPHYTDMAWMDLGAAPIHLPGDGSAHYDMDVTLVPILLSMF